MSLSEKIEESPTFGSGEFQFMIYAKDVREAVRELRQEMVILFNDGKMGYDKLSQKDFDLLFIKIFGEKLL